MKKYTYEDLIHIIETLRSENGCAWDREQTHESMVPYLLEESYEVVDAIQNKDADNLKEELGDLLLQVVMHAQIAKEEGSFTIDDVTHAISEKLIYRHPHVFGDEELKSSEEVLLRWEELKKKEKKQKTQTEAMEEVAKALPALTRAYKIQKKAAAVGIKKREEQAIIESILNQMKNVENAVKSGCEGKVNEEIGELLFSIVNLSYFFEINPEFALTNSTEKFINRFRYIENSAFAEGKQLSQLTAQEIDNLWQQCKKVDSNI